MSPPESHTVVCVLVEDCWLAVISGREIPQELVTIASPERYLVQSMVKSFTSAGVFVATTPIAISYCLKPTTNTRSLFATNASVEETRGSCAAKSRSSFMTVNTRNNGVGIWATDAIQSAGNRRLDTSEARCAANCCASVNTVTFQSDAVDPSRRTFALNSRPPPRSAASAAMNSAAPATSAIAAAFHSSGSGASIETDIVPVNSAGTRESSRRPVTSSTSVIASLRTEAAYSAFTEASLSTATVPSEDIAASRKTERWYSLQTAASRSTDDCHSTAITSSTETVTTPFHSSGNAASLRADVKYSSDTARSAIWLASSSCGNTASLLRNALYSRTIGLSATEEDLYS